jgi:hypothetical protein
MEFRKTNGNGRPMFRPRRYFCIALFCACFPLLWPAVSSAEPLKIQLDGLPVTVEYLPGSEKVADKVAAICRGGIPEIAAELGLASVDAFRIILITDMRVFQAQQGIRLPSWGVAFALMDSQVMLVDVQRATSAWNTLEKVIPHELSHLLVAQRVGDVRMPTWFVEGLAVWQAREWSLLENWRLMEAVWAKRAPLLGQITGSLPAAEGRARDAYRVAYTAFTERFDGEMDMLPLFLGSVVDEGSFSAAFERFWSENEYLYYERFDRELYRKYRSKLLFFQTGPLFSAVAVLFLFVFLRIKWKNRRTLKRLEQSERNLTPGRWERYDGTGR